MFSESSTTKETGTMPFQSKNLRRLFRRWIRIYKDCEERSRRRKANYAIFCDKDGFCVLKRRGLSGFPRRGDERMMRWNEITEIMEGQEGWIPATTLHLLDKHGYVAVVDEDMKNWEAAVRHLVANCPGFTEKALMRSSFNMEHQVLLYPADPASPPPAD